MAGIVDAASVMMLSHRSGRAAGRVGRCLRRRRRFSEPDSSLATFLLRREFYAGCFERATKRDHDRGIGGGRSALLSANDCAVIDMGRLGEPSRPPPQEPARLCDLRGRDRHDVLTFRREPTVMPCAHVGIPTIPPESFRNLYARAAATERQTGRNCSSTEVAQVSCGRTYDDVLGQRRRSAGGRSLGFKAATPVPSSRPGFSFSKCSENDRPAPASKGFRVRLALAQKSVHTIVRSLRRSFGHYPSRRGTSKSA